MDTATASHQPVVNPFATTQRPGSGESAVPEGAPVVRTEHRENLLTRMIEHQTAKIPSNLFLMLSLGAMTLSLVSEITGRSRASRFTGMWVSPLLTMGIYNKFVKTFTCGSEELRLVERNLDSSPQGRQNGPRRLEQFLFVRSVRL